MFYNEYFNKTQLQYILSQGKLQQINTHISNKVEYKY